MACIIYREGKGTIEHDIECESTSCEIEHLEGLLRSGWSLNPPGYEPPEPIADEDLPVDEKEPEVDVEAYLAEQVASLTSQLEILAEMDEKSQAEIARLTSELAEAEAYSEAQSDEITRLTGLLNPPADDAGGSGDGDATNLNPVRLAAKEKGIEGWDTKRIATLENLLLEA